MLFLAGFLILQTLSLAMVSASGADDITRFTVYYPLYLKSGVYVFPVDYVAPFNDLDTAALIKLALEELIAGPPLKPFRMMLTIPEDTRVIDVIVSDQIATVDLSQEIMDLNVGASGEMGILTALVNTVCQYPVTGVRFLVEGEEVETLAGHIELEGVLTPDFDALLRPMPDVWQHWSGGFVLTLQAMDIVDGYDDNTFKPDNKVSRSEFIKLLVEALELPDVQGIDVPFEDLDGHWASVYIKRALAAGFLVSDSYGALLKPDEIIPREEMAELLVRASDRFMEAHPEIAFSSETVTEFNDQDEIQAKYLASAVESAKRGFIRGYPDGSFGPKNGLTRGEAVTVIARMMAVDGENIILVCPKPGSPLTDNRDVLLVGAVTAFEGNINFRLADENDSEVLLSYATSTQGMGWGMFGICIKKELLTSTAASNVQVFLVSAEDGSEFSKVYLPLDG